MSSWPGLGAVVLSYGSGGGYGRVVDALLERGLAAADIVLVHNPAVPGEPLPGDARGCELVLTDHNLGYAAAMNLGIQRQLAAGRELILLLTHDAKLRGDSLGVLVAAARENPDFGALAPVLLYTGTESAFSYGGVDRWDGGVEHRKAPPPSSGGIAPCAWVDGGTILLRAEALRRVGGFDERFWGYAEDADLCLRLRRAGFGVGVVLGAQADQESGASKRPGPWAYLLTRNGLAYARRAGGLRALALLSARQAYLVLYELARAGAKALGLRPGSARGPWAVAVGTARGGIDFARGRWGPPPALPGAGDVANTRPAEGS